MFDRLRGIVKKETKIENACEVNCSTENKEEQREEWDRPIEFILSLIGCSVGEN